MKKTLYIFITFSLLLSGCKSYQKSTYTATKHLSKNKFIKQLDEHQFKEQSFESRIGISYDDGQKRISGNGRLKILKDSIIWGSLNFLGIPMVKFYITPQKVQYYNKINQTYYQGDFKLIERELGVDLNFNNLQNLLLGDLLVVVPKRNLKIETKKKFYILNPKNSYIKMAQIAPFFKVLSQNIKVTKQPPILVTYTDYKLVKKENLPSKIQIETGQKLIKINYKNIETGKDLHFPFQIPNNYQLLRL